MITETKRPEDIRNQIDNDLRKEKQRNATGSYYVVERGELKKVESK